MQTSTRGVLMIEHHEGVVLRAYKDIAGIWTIGAGLTAASGVVKPAQGMEITKEQSRVLLAAALKENYEPAVLKALGGPQADIPQNVFDAAVGFHWNTGAINRASWVTHWRKSPKDWRQIEHRFKAWSKATVKGSRVVVRGLVRRRDDEFNLLRYGWYPDAKGTVAAGARFTTAPSAAQIKAIRKGLSRLGYDVKADEGIVPACAVRKFQRAEDLRIDGIIGPATLNTLQRALDRRGLGPFKRFIRRFT